MAALQHCNNCQDSGLGWNRPRGCEIGKEPGLEILEGAQKVPKIIRLFRRGTANLARPSKGLVRAATVPVTSAERNDFEVLGLLNGKIGSAGKIQMDMKWI